MEVVAQQIRVALLGKVHDPFNTDKLSDNSKIRIKNYATLLYVTAQNFPEKKSRMNQPNDM